MTGRLQYAAVTGVSSSNKMQAAAQMPQTNSERPWLLSPVPLGMQVQQRDNEINILVAMLKKRGGALAASGSVAAVPPPGLQQLGGAAAAGAAAPAAQAHSSQTGAAAVAQPARPATDVTVPEERQDVAAAQAALLDGKVLKDRTAAFELFRKSYKRNAAIEDNKAVRSFVKHSLDILRPEYVVWLCHFCSMQWLHASLSKLALSNHNAMSSLSTKQC